VRDVVLGPDGIVAGMAPGGIVAIHSTVSPTTVRAVAAEAARHGVDLLDAPVSGGNAGARAGTMTVMIGGSPEAVARARPVFDSFATTVAHLGPVGAGQSMKLLNNTLCYANAAMSVAALEVAEAQGMDLGPVRTIIGKSSGNSVGFSLVGDPTLLAKASGRSSNVRKDVQHFLDTLSANGIEASPLGDVAATAADRLEAWSAHVSARCTDPAATR
jgi:3-hydroxyisobutyrate dehydrogenase-like beta-hydroxyacid dehydrogenase